MLLGHVALGLAAKKAMPEASLWLTIPAALACDLLAIPGFLSGEPSLQPVSHGLFMAGIWSLLALTLGWAIGKKPSWGILPALLVASHWILDFISWPLKIGGIPSEDGLYLFFLGSPKVGLGLYTTWPGVIASEGLAFVAIVLLTIGFAKKPSERRSGPGRREG